jgi:hypothetical protein
MEPSNNVAFLLHDIIELLQNVWIWADPENPSPRKE